MDITLFFFLPFLQRERTSVLSYLLRRMKKHLQMGSSFKAKNLLLGANSFL